MFHVSFLVKQRVVQLSVDDSIGLPVLEPVSSRVRDAAEEGGGGKNQVSVQSFVNIRSDDKPDNNGYTQASNNVIFTNNHTLSTFNIHLKTYPLIHARVL